MLYLKPVYLVDTTASDAGNGNGSERSRTAYTTLKAAVLAPMPSASEAHAVARKAGFAASRRSAYLSSISPLGRRRQPPRWPEAPQEPGVRGHRSDRLPADHLFGAA